MGRYIDASINAKNELEPFEFTATNGQTIFTLPKSGEPLLFVNGAVQRKTTDFTLSGEVATFVTPLNLNDSVTGVVFENGKEFHPNMDAEISVHSGTGEVAQTGFDYGTNTQIVFETTFDMGSNTGIIVILDGVIQKFGDSYDVLSTPSAIGFYSIPDAGTDNIIVIGLGRKNTILEAAPFSISHDRLTAGQRTNIGRKNHIINGNFDIWQRGTSFTEVDTTTTRFADKWISQPNTLVLGAAITREAFTVGQTDVPNNPKYYLQYSFPDSNSVDPKITQRIEDVSIYSGVTMTLSFWSKSSSTQNFQVFYLQRFGGPIIDDKVINQSLFTSTTTWTKHTVTTTFPTIEGEVLSTSNWLDVRIDPNELTTYDFSLAQFQLEYGSQATNFEYRPPSEELELCQRYFEKSYNVETDPGTITTTGAARMRRSNLSTNLTNITPKYKVRKRVVPTITTYSPTTGASGQIRNDTDGVDEASVVQSSGETGFSTLSTTARAASSLTLVHWTASADL